MQSERSGEERRSNEPSAHPAVLVACGAASGDDSGSEARVWVEGRDTIYAYYADDEGGDTLWDADLATDLTYAYTEEECAEILWGADVCGDANVPEVHGDKKGGRREELPANDEKPAPGAD